MIERVVEGKSTISSRKSLPTTPDGQAPPEETDWFEGLLEVLEKHQLREAGGLFERAYAYIAEHY